ncbi:FKBP-type peptidyl-prolyl cis-trans isomerase [Bacteroidales bacterium OttesenSCG-928-B11]|nr:FKBP-type peptidyl-prolyl cis-trans isomerase [Bacteroidales bacterium OttesenSCG-928-B11]MDL2326581.1 FKBP-type peptidyl-prolyl cis-trans isomerase [Bacteroidales bacterium OttesenSCG-928-A14]
MKIDHRLLFFLVFPLILPQYGCKDKTPTGIVQISQHETDETHDPLIQTNAKIVQLEDEEIALFIRRYGWDMEKTKSGLRYQITKTTDGKRPVQGNEVSLKYTMLLLSGETVYSSKEDGLMMFAVEKSDAIAGLHEAVQLMRKGETARLVIPSHLAYGASGDAVRIGRYSPVALIVELIEVK